MRLLLVVALAWSAAGGKHGKCLPLDPKKPCLVECPGTPIIRFNLKPLQSTPWLTATDGSGHNYFFDACTELTEVTCGSATGKTVAAIQSWQGKPPHFESGSCAMLGCYATQNCTVEDGPLGSGVPPSMVCKYTGGDEGRSVTTRFECAPHLPTPTFSASQDSSQSDGTSYTITVRGANSCGVVWVRPLSWGSLSLIFLLVGATLYLAGGVGYNVKVGKKQGKDAIPQLRYWRQLPGLVKDGCAFSWTMGRKGYYKLRHGSAPPLDSSLKQRLAENEGGDDRT